MDDRRAVARRAVKFVVITKPVAIVMNGENELVYAEIVFRHPPHLDGGRILHRFTRVDDGARGGSRCDGYDARVRLRSRGGNKKNDHGYEGLGPRCHMSDVRRVF